jgi:hypothetical protein
MHDLKNILKLRTYSSVTVIEPGVRHYFIGVYYTYVVDVFTSSENPDENSAMYWFCLNHDNLMGTPIFLKEYEKRIRSWVSVGSYEEACELIKEHNYRTACAYLNPAALCKLIMDPIAYMCSDNAPAINNYKSDLIYGQEFVSLFGAYNIVYDVYTNNSLGYIYFNDVFPAYTSNMGITNTKIFYGDVDDKNEVQRIIKNHEHEFFMLNHINYEKT